MEDSKDAFDFNVSNPVFINEIDDLVTKIDEIKSGRKIKIQFKMPLTKVEEEHFAEVLSWVFAQFIEHASSQDQVI